MPNILEEIKEDNREAAEWLLYYPFRRQQFYKNKKDAICASATLQQVITRTGPGNPTAIQAMRLTNLDEDEKWLEVVEILESLLSEKKLIFLKYRREAAYITKRVRGRAAWVLYVQRHYADEMALQYRTQPEKFWLSERTIRDWWGQMVELAARIATKRGNFKKSK